MTQQEIDELNALFNAWDRGDFRDTVARVRHLDAHKAARIAAQIALERGSNEATVFCDLLEQH